MPRARTVPAAVAARAPGFRRPTTTPVPDELFDEWLAILSGAELKCLLYIVRRTLGFKKDADAISLSQMVAGITTRDGRVLDTGTGLNRSTVVEALASLDSRGLIVIVRASDQQGAALTSTYALRWRDESGGSGPAGVPGAPPEPAIPRQRRAGSAVALAATAVTAPVALEKPIPVVGKSNHGAAKASLVDGKSDQGSRKKRPGWLENPRAVVGESNSQQTDQETGNNDDSNRVAVTNAKAPMEMGPCYSPYIAGVVLDYSRELGDPLHMPANVTQALRLWQASARDESAFVALLHEARARVRLYQGKQGTGAIHNRMAYYFRVLEDLLAPDA